MARIAGVDIPRDKRVEIALTYIYGIGPTRSVKVLTDTQIDKNIRVKDLTDDQLVAIRDYLDGNYKVEGDLRRDVAADIRRKVEIGSYEGNSALFIANNFKNCDLIYCLDTWKGSDEHINYDSKIIEKNFDNNLKDFKNVYKIKDNSDNFFLQNNNKFEVIYIDGSHLASQVYKDCLNAWSILQTDGFLICDDYIWSHYKKIQDNPCFAINAFLSTIKNQYNLLIVSNNQIIIKKII